MNTVMEVLYLDGFDFDDDAIGDFAVHREVRDTVMTCPADSDDKLTAAMYWESQY